MANTLIRDKVKVLRTQGASLNELAVKFGIPKSTIRYWCRDITLTRVQLKRLFKKQKLGGIHAAEKLRKKRLLLIRKLVVEGEKEVGTLSPRELLLVGTALYWAEGYRKGDGEFGFTNSDPKMVRLIIRWLEKVCGVARDKIRLRICINTSHRYRIGKVHKFWIHATGIPYIQFSNPTFIQSTSKKNYLNPQEYYGVMRIKVKQSTNLRRKIHGWIEGIAAIS